MGFLKNLLGQGLRPPERMFVDQPLGIRHILLLHFVTSSEMSRESLDTMKRYSDYADALFNIMLDLNTRGSEAEAAGNLDGAIACFEQNVAALFPGTHPYERLRIIYTKQKRCADALRVCHAYISTQEAIDRVMGRKSKSDTKRKRFQEWIKKLEANS